MATDRTSVAATALHDPNKGYDDKGGNIIRSFSLLGGHGHCSDTPHPFTTPQVAAASFRKAAISHRFAPHFQGAQFVFPGRTSSVLEGRGGLNERRNVGVVINRCNQSAAPLYPDSTLLLLLWREDEDWNVANADK